MGNVFGKKWEKMFRGGLLKAAFYGFPGVG